MASNSSSILENLVLLIRAQCIENLLRNLTLANVSDAIYYNTTLKNEEFDDIVNQNSTDALDNLISTKCNFSIDSFLNQDNIGDYEDAKQSKNRLIMAAYVLIIAVSIFGNSLVIFTYYHQSRRSTVNIFIGNLAASDLMMTIFNIPFSCARILLDNWPFGSILCHFVPFAQATSVYVSTLTMAFIAFDRFQAILHPIRTRLSTRIGHHWVLAWIWSISAILSLPFGFFTRLVKVESQLYYEAIGNM